MSVSFTISSSSPPSGKLRKQHTIFEKGYRSNDGNISQAFDTICGRFLDSLNSKKESGLTLDDCKCIAFFAIDDHIPLLDTETLMNTENRPILESTSRDRSSIETRLKTHLKTRKLDYDKVLKSLKDELIKLVERPTIKSGRHTQVAGSIGYDPDTNSLCVLKGVTHSQERANKAALNDENASNANLACIDFEGSLSVGRSGCPDSKAKVLELLRFLAFMELEKQIETGKFDVTSPSSSSDQLRFNASEVFMMTLMDLDFLKQLGETFSKKSESDRIKEIQIAVEKLTSNDLMCSTTVNDQRVLVLLKKPSVSICPFSFSTTTAMATARAAKKEPYAKKFDRLVKLWEKNTSIFMKPIVEAMKQDPRHFDTIFNTIGAIIRTTQDQNIPIPEHVLGALNALKIGLSEDKTTLDGMSLKGEAGLGVRNPDTIIEFIFDVMLTKELGDILAVSCKSGQDRTGTAAALVVALENYMEITGHYFLPTPETKPWEDPLFKFLFTMAIDDFCESFHRITRGEGVDLKPGKHPGFSKLYVSDPNERKALAEHVYTLPEVQTYNLATLQALPDLKEDPLAGGFFRHFEKSTSSPLESYTFWSSSNTNTFTTRTLPNMIHDYFSTLDPEDHDPTNKNFKRLDLHLQPKSPVITFKDPAGKRSSVLPPPPPISTLPSGAAAENENEELTLRRPTRGSNSFSTVISYGMKRLSSATKLTSSGKPKSEVEVDIGTATSALTELSASEFYSNPMRKPTESD